MKLKPETIAQMKEKAGNRWWSPLLVAKASQFNKSGMRILEIGINGDVLPGANAYLFDKAEYKTLDIKDIGADYTHDLRNLPFPNGSFDLVICTCVLEHITEQRELAVRELIRIAKSTILLAFPEAFDENEEKPFSPVSFDWILPFFGGLQVPFLFRTDKDVVYFEVNK